jgi:hypothetical protein
MEAWLAAIRDDPRRPPPHQVHALTMLALRVDWTTGTGFASGQQLAADAEATERTVKRATRWAREAGYVVQTRRGHRISEGVAAASEWQLIQPDGSRTQQDMPVPLATQQDMPVPLAGRTQGDRATGPRGQSHRPKGTPGPHHQESSTSRSSSSTARVRSPADLIRAVYPSATNDEIEIIVKDRINNGARSPEAVVAYEIRQGTLRLPCDCDGSGLHSNACRDGDSLGCAYHDEPGEDWCTCRCHTQPVIKL